MRSISGETQWMVLLLYWFFSLMAWYSIRLLLRKSKNRTVRRSTFLYWGVAILQSFLFLFFYAFPPLSVEGRMFMAYFLFNGILMADFAAKIPLTMSTFLMFPLRKTPVAETLAFMGVILSTGLLLVFVWGITLGRNSLHVNENVVEVDGLPSALEGMRIVHISDLHAGSFNNRGLGERMKQVCNGFDPDLLIFTGDLVNNFAWEAPRVEPWLRHFQASKGKYAVLGNHDYGDYTRWKSPEAKAANLDGIKQAYRRMGFRLLLNESERLYCNGDSLYITGVENWGHPPFSRYANLPEALRGVPPEPFRILLTHDPAHWDNELKYSGSFPLTLSGHTHGFQWGIKLAGIPFSTAWFHTRRWGGVYRHDTSTLVVNRGTGTIGMLFRIDMPAEITLITLKRR